MYTSLGFNRTMRCFRLPLLERTRYLAKFLDSISYQEDISNLQRTMIAKFRRKEQVLIWPKNLSSTLTSAVPRHSISNNIGIPPNICKGKFNKEKCNFSSENAGFREGNSVVIRLYRDIGNIKVLPRLLIYFFSCNFMRS